MREVEVKVRLPDPAALRAKLLEVGAHAVGYGIEDDLFFLHPMRDFTATDEVLRLRRGSEGLVLTYKGPNKGGPGNVKDRLEHNIPLGADPTAMLAALDFRPGPRLRKQRERFRLGEVEVSIDQLEGVGSFAEVEARGLAPGGSNDVAGAARLITDTLKRLGLSQHAVEPRSYLEMVLAR